jgi:hypothetical protein
VRLSANCRYGVVVLATWILACSSPGSSSGTGGATGAGGPTGGGGGSSGTGGAGCSSDPTWIAAAPTCSTVPNGATAVPFTAKTGAAPTPMGGPIRDGLYYATRADGYGMITPSGRRLTLVVSGAGTQLLWIGEVLDPAGAAVTLSFRANASAVISGTTIALTTTCSSASMSPLPPAMTYTASGSDLSLGVINGADGAVTTYTRQGCP